MDGKPTTMTTSITVDKRLGRIEHRQCVCFRSSSFKLQVSRTVRIIDIIRDYSITHPQSGVRHSLHQPHRILKVTVDGDCDCLSSITRGSIRTKPVHEFRQREKKELTLAKI